MARPCIPTLQILSLNSEISSEFRFRNHDRRGFTLCFGSLIAYGLSLFGSQKIPSSIPLFYSEFLPYFASLYPTGKTMLNSETMDAAIFKISLPWNFGFAPILATTTSSTDEYHGMYTSNFRIKTWPSIH